MTSRRIIALGGGGFSNRAGQINALDRYVLEQSGRACPRICFLGTASGDADSYVTKFYSTFTLHECRPTHFPLFARTPDPRAVLLDQDVIYVGGGNTFSMLAVWRAWGLDAILSEACESGVVLAGVSAGAICWFEQGLTDSSGAALGPLAGLGLLAGSCCPHYSSEPERRPAYLDLVASGTAAAGIALEDGVAGFFCDGELQQVVSDRAEGMAYAVARHEGGVEETPLEVEHLAAEKGPGS